MQLSYLHTSDDMVMLLWLRKTLRIARSTPNALLIQQTKALSVCSFVRQGSKSELLIVSEGFRRFCFITNGRRQTPVLTRTKMASRPLSFPQPASGFPAPLSWRVAAQESTATFSGGDLYQTNSGSSPENEEIPQLVSGWPAQCLRATLFN